MTFLLKMVISFLLQVRREGIVILWIIVRFSLLQRFALYYYKTIKHVHICLGKRADTMASCMYYTYCARKGTWQRCALTHVSGCIGWQWHDILTKCICLICSSFSCCLPSPTTCNNEYFMCVSYRILFWRYMGGFQFNPRCVPLWYSSPSKWCLRPRH